MGNVLQPKGEELRRAIRWVSDRRRDEPKLPIWKLAEEASVRFDLSPADSEFLLRALSDGPPQES